MGYHFTGKIQVLFFGGYVQFLLKNKKSLLFEFIFNTEPTYFGEKNNLF